MKKESFLFVKFLIIDNNINCLDTAELKMLNFLAKKTGLARRNYIGRLLKKNILENQNTLESFQKRNLIKEEK